MNDDKISPLTNEEEACMLSAELVITKSQDDSHPSLQDFKFIKLISTGKYGKVYLAEHKSS